MATPISYQVSGSLSFSIDGQWIDTDVWGSAVISDEPYGDMTRSDYAYHPDWASSSNFFYSIENYAIGHDFGSVAGTNGLLMSEPSSNYVNAYSYANIGLGWAEYEFLYLDGTPFSSEINIGENLFDTDYGKLAPIITMSYYNYHDGDYFGTIQLTKVTPTTPVPEPATMLLFGTGIAGLAAVGRKRRKK